MYKKSLRLAVGRRVAKTTSRKVADIVATSQNVVNDEATSQNVENKTASKDFKSAAVTSQQIVNNEKTAKSVNDERISKNDKNEKSNKSEIDDDDDSPANEGNLVKNLFTVGICRYPSTSHQLKGNRKSNLSWPFMLTLPYNMF